MVCVTNTFGIIHLIVNLDGYFCHNTFHLKLPGISINAFNYHNGEQKIRYVCKTREDSKIFFAFQFELVPRTEYPGLD